LVALHYKEDDTAELVNGGHVLPVVISEGPRAELIRDGDLPVGLFRDTTFHSIPLDLPRGARVVLMSDGVSEAENPEGSQFGATEMTREMAGAEPINDVFASMQKFCAGEPAHDDCTILVIERLT
jgi:serine phosphatase RsbU (regulator of sigma subunit)